MTQNGKMVDLESGLTAAAPVVAMEEQVEVRNTSDTSSSSWSPSRGWRIYASLLAIGLCAAAAIFFSFHHQNKNTSMGNTDLRHILRKIRSATTESPKESPVIHVVGNYNPSFSDKTVEWQSNDELSYVSGGLTLNQNEIVIPNDGLYFVYSQVSFEINCHKSPLPSTSSEEERYHLAHDVLRKTSTRDEKVTLLSASRSGCKYQPSEDGKDSGRRWYGTINMEAIFQLRKNDRLSTRTQPVSYVADGLGKTYLGVFAISEHRRQ